MNSVLPAIPTHQIDQFEFLSIVGEGGSKIVWLVKDIVSKNIKALAQFRLPEIEEGPESEFEGARQIKIRMAEWEAQIIQEANLMIKLAEAIHVVSLEGFVKDKQNCLFFLMPYYSNGNLEKYLQHHNLTTHQKWQIALDLLQGLQQCQTRSICISDIKPSNVLLDAQIRAAIADFGTAFITQNTAQMGVDTYNLFKFVFTKMFNEHDCKINDFVKKFILKYNSTSFPLCEQIIPLWINLKPKPLITLIKHSLGFSFQIDFEIYPLTTIFEQKHHGHLLKTSQTQERKKTSKPHHQRHLLKTSTPYQQKDLLLIPRVRTVLMRAADL